MQNSIAMLICMLSELLETLYALLLLLIVRLDSRSFYIEGSISDSRASLKSETFAKPFISPV